MNTRLARLLTLSASLMLVQPAFAQATSPAEPAAAEPSLAAPPEAVAPPPAPPTAYVPTTPPPGFGDRPRRRQGVALYAVGLSIFGASYLPMSAFGWYAFNSNASAVGAFAQVPVVGPLVLGGFSFAAAPQTSDPQLARTLGTLFVLDGAAQAAGIALAIVGHVRMARSERAPRVVVAPGAAGANLGLTVAGTF